ncbi:putative F-box protein [Salvia divinorum]|uniref:F-box protein n=1 Tax=Salvia divinorum TaxID=28513 RepID=A0ABD1I0F4_SALDI
MESGELHLHVLSNTTTARAGFDGSEVYRVRPCLYSCPSLKVLTLQSCNFEVYGNVQWDKLESLKINRIGATADVISQIWSDASVVSELKICTLNLETLEIKGFPYKKYSLTDVSSLTRAVLGSLPLCHIWLTRLSSPLSQILPSIQHVENVALSDCCTKNVKSLELTCWSD